MTIHIGKKIKDELYKQKFSVTTFARKIERTRNVVYDIFGRESIDTALLNKIGLILKVDFFSVYSGQKEYKKEGIAPLVLKEDAAVYSSVAKQTVQLEKQNKALQKEIADLKKAMKSSKKDSKKKDSKKKKK